MLKDNSEEWSWSTSEKIEIEARVENRNDESATYILEAIFIDSDDDEIEIATESNDLKKEFLLSAHERTSISLNFEIDEDTEKDDYNLHIKFYKKGDEDKECVENSDEQIKIEKIELCEEGNVDKADLEIKKITDEMDDNEIEWQWEPEREIEISIDFKNKVYSQRTFVIELIMLNENNEKIIFAKDPEKIKKSITLDEDESEEVSTYFTLSSEIEEGKYALYAKAYDEDNEEICTSLKAESKSNPIKVTVEKPERRVAITKVEGPKEVQTFEEITYTATVTNFGAEDEDKVSILAYNYKLGIREIVEISNLNSGETKNATFQITIPENASLIKHTIIFSANYEYNAKSDYYKSSSDEMDEIRHYITISERTPTEPVEKIIEEENETTNETTNVNPKNNTSTIMTGNVIGVSNKSFSWPIIVGLLILALIGIYLFFKKPQRREPKHREPIITKRYTARLN